MVLRWYHDPNECPCPLTMSSEDFCCSGCRPGLSDWVDRARMNLLCFLMMTAFLLACLWMAEG